MMEFEMRWPPEDDDFDEIPIYYTIPNGKGPWIDFKKFIDDLSLQIKYPKDEDILGYEETNSVEHEIPNYVQASTGEQSPIAFESKPTFPIAPHGALDFIGYLDYTNQKAVPRDAIILLDGYKMYPDDCNILPPGHMAVKELTDEDKKHELNKYYVTIFSLAIVTTVSIGLMSYYNVPKEAWTTAVAIVGTLGVLVGQQKRH